MGKESEQGIRTVEIRGMEAKDADAVCELIAQLGYERSAQDVRRWIEALDATAGDRTALVACLHQEVVGWVEVSIERRLQSAPFALIGGLVVRDGARSGGIGRLLCAAAETWSRDRGLKTLRVTSRSTRTDAHRFYLRDEYKPVKISMVFEKKLR